MLLLCFDTYYHSIIHDKINIHALLPPVFICKVWKYSKADVQSIQKVKGSKVDLPNETLLNISRNYIPNKNQM